MRVKEIYLHWFSSSSLINVSFPMSTPHWQMTIPLKSWTDTRRIKSKQNIFPNLNKKSKRKRQIWCLKASIYQQQLFEVHEYIGRWGCRITRIWTESDYTLDTDNMNECVRVHFYLQIVFNLKTCFCSRLEERVFSQV